MTFTGWVKGYLKEYKTPPKLMDDELYGGSIPTWSNIFNCVDIEPSMVLVYSN